MNPRHLLQGAVTFALMLSSYAGLMMLTGVVGPKIVAPAAQASVDAERMVWIAPDVPDGADAEGVIEPEAIEEIAAGGGEAGAGPATPGEVSAAIAPPVGGGGGEAGVVVSYGRGERTRDGRKKTPRKTKSGDCAPTEASIQQRGLYEYSVSRSLLDTYTGDLSAAARLASAAWHRDGDGEIDGVRLWNMGCGNLLRQAGLRNGDVVHEINGQRVDSLTRALKVYWQTRSDRVLRLKLTRRDGSASKLTYRLN